MAINPFVVSMLAAGDSFVNREAELARIETAFATAGGKLVVYGDRRLGKSSALEHAATAVRNRKGRVAIASLATASNASEAAQRVLSAAQKEVGAAWREILEGVARSLRTGFEVSPSADPTGMPSVKFTFGVDPTTTPVGLLPDVLNALNDQLTRRNIHLGLGLDEFQRIHEWGGEDAEWAFREAVQRHATLAYVLAGSKRHLIEAMVGSKARALWKQADVLRFGPIDADVLAAWVTERALATALVIPDAEAHAIVGLAGPRTRDIVQLARVVWALHREAGFAAPGSAAAAMDQIARDQAELYRAIFVKLNARQQGVLRAFAADPHVQITSAATARLHRLGPKSTVHSTVESLVDDEHLARLDVGYGFDDPFFQRWVQVYALPDIGVTPPVLKPRHGTSE